VGLRPTGVCGGGVCGQGDSSRALFRFMLSTGGPNICFLPARPRTTGPPPKKDHALRVWLHHCPHSTHITPKERGTAPADPHPPAFYPTAPPPSLMFIHKPTAPQGSRHSTPQTPSTTSTTASHVHDYRGEKGAYLST